MSTTRTRQHSRWTRLTWIVPLAIAILAVLVLLARALRSTTPIHDFLHTYPGRPALPGWAPVGFPGWLEWQHGLNAFFLLLIIRTGLQVHTQQRPEAYWTRTNTGPLRTRGTPKKISLMLWLHLSLDALWVLNGLLFIVLILTTGQWVRIVPTSWDVFPQALSTAIQYASLDWPNENGWIGYNGLQLLSYFLVVFVAAPISILTGLRLSAAWPTAARINRIYPIGLARALHYPTMIFFALFIIAHVTLVLATGAVNNLNHMYAGRNDQSWAGFVIFAATLIVTIIGWTAARPVLLRPIATLTGKVTAR